jgi:hypothetical protein
VARQKELLTLSAISQETGISQATLAKYAAEYDDIPSEGEGRSRRYPRSAVKMFQRLRKESKPGRRAGGSSPNPAKATAEAPAKQAPVRNPGVAPRQAPAAAPSFPSTFRLEPSTLSLEPLRLADEDRELLRGLVVALGGVEGQLRALSMSVGAIETELASMGNRTAPNPPAPRHGGGPSGAPPKHSGAKQFQRPRARHSQHSSHQQSNPQQPNTPRPFADGHEGGNG